MTLRRAPRYFQEKTEIRCAVCKNVLRRLSRKGFLQTRIYPLFGYYPWECPLCREMILIKKKLQHKHITIPETSAF